jgi:hypothetical protein
MAPILLLTILLSPLGFLVFLGVRSTDAARPFRAPSAPAVLPPESPVGERS